MTVYDEGGVERKKRQLQLVCDLMHLHNIYRYPTNPFK